MSLVRPPLALFPSILDPPLPHAEHMEEDDDTTKVVPPWVQLEYAQMLKHAGPHSEVFFTSLSSQSAEILPKKLEEAGFAFRLYDLEEALADVVR